MLLSLLLLRAWGRGVVEVVTAFHSIIPKQLFTHPGPTIASAEFCRFMFHSSCRTASGQIVTRIASPSLPSLIFHSVLCPASSMLAADVDFHFHLQNLFCKFSKSAPSTPLTMACKARASPHEGWSPSVVHHIGGVEGAYLSPASPARSVNSPLLGWSHLGISVLNLGLTTSIASVFFSSSPIFTV